MPETQVLLKKAVTLALWGKRHAGRQGPTAWGAMGAVLGVLLRDYGFTDLPPSLRLPLPRSDPVTRIRKSSYRRQLTAGPYIRLSHIGIIATETCGARARVTRPCEIILYLSDAPPGTGSILLDTSTPR